MTNDFLKHRADKYIRTILTHIYFLIWTTNDYYEENEKTNGFYYRFKSLRRHTDFFLPLVSLLSCAFCYPIRILQQKKKDDATLGMKVICSLLQMNYL